MDIGFEFNIIFNKELDVSQQEILWGNFVNFVEEHKMFWGGGHGNSYIKGYLDCSHSKIDLLELIKKTFEYFIKLNLAKTIEILYSSDSNIYL